MSHTGWRWKSSFLEGFNNFESPPSEFCEERCVHCVVPATRITLALFYQLIARGVL